MPIRPDLKPRYPRDWRAISLTIRKLRANDYCEGCGARNGEPHPLTGAIVVLACAHRNHVPEDCRGSNLRAWCALCHNGHDAKHRARTRVERHRRQLGMQPFAFDEHRVCRWCGAVVPTGVRCATCGGAE